MTEQRNLANDAQLHDAAEAARRARLDEESTLVLVTLVGPYNGADAHGWHLMMRRDRATHSSYRSILGGPFASYADAMAAARAAGMTVENEYAKTTYGGDHADDVDAAREQVARGE